MRLFNRNFLSYLTENTTRACYKDHSLNAVQCNYGYSYCDNHTEHSNTLRAKMRGSLMLRRTIHAVTIGPKHFILNVPYSCNVAMADHRSAILHYVICKRRQKKCCNIYSWNQNYGFLIRHPDPPNSVSSDGICFISFSSPRTYHRPFYLLVRWLGHLCIASHDGRASRPTASLKCCPGKSTRARG